MNKVMMLVVLAGLSFAGSANACEDCKKLKEVCKTECPSVKNEKDAFKCMTGVAKKKGKDEEFKKSECFAAYEHAKHEKEGEHNHSH